MKFFGFELKKCTPSARRQMRMFDGARTGSLADFGGLVPNINEDTRANLKLLKMRSRELAKNNNIFRKYLSMRERNIVGHKGVMIQNRAKLPDGSMNDAINDEIEAAWAEWGRIGCESSNKMTWIDVQRMVARTVAVDGEAFIAINRGTGRGGISLRFIDSMACDTDYNIDSAPTGGVRVISGVEVDDNYKPLAYYFMSRRSESTTSGLASYSRIRIPAENMIHVFRQEYVDQVRGIPSAQSAMIPMNMLKGYSEAELAAARASACKMGFYTSKDGGLQGVSDGKDAEGTFFKEAAPGQFDLLPPGYEFEAFNPTHPNGNYGGFTQAMIREIAGGLDVAYNALASDLTSVNFSSMRSGSLEERDAWMTEQGILISQFVEPVFRLWFNWWASTGKSQFRPSILLSSFAPSFFPRRWPWVDPRADAEANVTLMQNNMKSPYDIAGEMGYDLDDMYSSIAKARELRKKYKIPEAATSPAAMAAVAPNVEAEDDEDVDSVDVPKNDG
jgi:lambda family phage portal protein